MAKKQNNDTGSGFGNFLAVICVFAAIISVFAGMAKSTKSDGLMATATVESNLYESTPIPTHFGVSMDCTQRGCEQERWP